MDLLSLLLDAAIGAPDEGGFFSSDSWFGTLAALVFLFGGIFMLIKTVRHSLMKSKVEIEEEYKKQQAQSEYWRTMDRAIERLGEAIDEIDAGLDQRADRLRRLSDEATDVLSRLANAIKEAESETQQVQKTTARMRAAQKEATDKASESNIIEFKTASEALVRKTHRKVYAAFDKGKTIQEISRDTGLQIGEIELILALRDRMRESSSSSAGA